MDSEGRKKALIIGVSDYERNPNFVSLQICKNDCISMYETLKEAKFTIHDSHRISGKVDKKTMEESIVNFFRKDVVPNDTLLFYYTGHGYVDEYGEGYFCTSDIDAHLPELNGVKFKFLTEEMNKSLSQKKIAILDCCNSGEALSSEDEIELGQVDKEAQAVEKGRGAMNKEFVQSRLDADILASSLSNKESFGLPNNQFSAFSYYILEGLKKNKETVDEEGCVTPEKLFLYVARKLFELQGSDSQRPIQHIPNKEMILAKYKDFAKPDVIQMFSPYLAAIKNAKLRSSEQKSALLEMLIHVRLNQSFLDEQTTISSLFRSYKSSMDEQILLSSGEEIDDTNWSFDDKKNFITNKTLWKGIQLRRTIKAKYDLTDFWMKFKKDVGGNIVATYQPEGPGDTGTAVIKQKELRGVGRVFELNYIGSLGSKYYDALKIIDNNTIIGQCYYGEIDSSGLLYDYILTRTYALDYMTEADHAFLLKKQKIPTYELVQGDWEVKILNNFSVKVPPLYFQLKNKDENIEVSYFINDSTVLSDGVDRDSKKQLTLGTEKIDKFRILSKNVLLGIIDTDSDNLKIMIPKIPDYDLKQNPMKLRCILKKVSW